MRRRRRNRNGNSNNNGNHNQPRKPKFTGRISDHFSKKDFSFSDKDGKDRLKISMGLVGGLEMLRSLAKSRVNIQRGFISQEMAEKEGNWKRNYHPLGLAADVTVDGMSNEELFLLAEQVPEFKGIGLSIDGKHVHVDTRKTEERVLWIEDRGSIIDLDDSLRGQYGLVPKEAEVDTPLQDKNASSEDK